MTLAATPESPVARRLGTLAIGFVLVGGGVALMIRAQIGVAPYDVLTTGVAAALRISIGLAAMIVPLGFVGLALALGRRPGPGTVLAVALIGPIIAGILHGIPHIEAMGPRLVLFAVGYLVVAAGVTAVIIAEIGPGPAEVLMLALHARGAPLAPARTAIELTSVAIGWAIGGQVGVGTVVVALTIGPILRWMLGLSGFPAGPRAKQIGVSELSDLASPGV